MNCIVIDDEPLAREGVKMLIEDFPSLRFVQEFGSAIHTMDFLKKNEVDLIFLDIEMPGLTGLEFLKSLNIRPHVILTTAYPQHALEAYDLDVIDYLVKPIRKERFIKAVNKVKDIYDLRNEVLYNLEPKVDDHIFIRADRKYVKLKYSDINYIQGLKDYVMIYTSYKKYLTAMNIKTILQQLPNNIFIRTAKSYIINMHNIQQIDIDSVHIDSVEIPLGNSYKDNFKEVVIGNRLVDRKKSKNK